MSLASDLSASLALLHRRSESVSAVMGTNKGEDRIVRAMEALELLARQQQIPIAIVGGLAAIRYGYPAVTEDIDIAVAKAQL